MNRNALIFIEAFPEAALLLNPRGELLTANDKAQTLIDIPPSSGAGLYLDQVACDDRQRIADALTLWSGSATPIPQRLTFFCPREGVSARRCDGWRWASNWGDYIVVRILAADHTSRLSELTRTIDRLNAECAAREAVERDLRRLLRQMNSQNSMRDVVLSQVSHDLRTPLNAILGLSEFMLEEPFGSLHDRYRGYIADIRFSGHALLELVDKVLAMSLDATVPEEAVGVLSDLKTCIQNSLRVVEPIADRRNIEIVVPESMSLPELKADQILVKQILTNLLGNAVKHIQEGGRVELKAHCWDEGGVELQVVDNGPGIPEEKRQEIFSSSPRNAFLSGEGGVGVGLRLSRSAAASLGATLTIESGPAGGTTAALYFPPEVVEDSGTVS